MYGLPVKKVHTINYEGRKYRNKLMPNKWYKQKDWKKAYIDLWTDDEVNDSAAA